MSELENSGRSGPAVIPAETQRNWNRVAEGLFSSVMTRPDIYQRVTVLIGLATGLLRDRRAGAEELLAVCEAPEHFLAEVLAAHPQQSLEGLDAGQLVAAACAMRYREVVDESAAAARSAALAAGKGDEWVVLTETGPFEGDPFVPYQRLEGHRALRLAVAIATRPDDTFAGCIHSVDVLVIDPDSGGLGTAPVADDLSIECATAGEREDHVVRIKAALESSDKRKN